MDLPLHKKIILFDGICNFCNTTVIKIIALDKKNVFVFASLQSAVGSEIINRTGIDSEKIDSIILYEPNLSYDIKSSAVLKIMNNFNGLWKLSQLFWIVPKPLRDLVYDFIAKNRYNWFGKKTSCMLPTLELKEKFLS